MNRQNLAQIENSYQQQTWPSAEEMHRLLGEGRKLHAASFSLVVGKAMRKLLGHKHSTA